MAGQGKIRRFTLVVEIINRVQCPSFKDIKQFLYNNGFEVGRRTVERDIEHIRYEFGVDIKYNREKNGYYIDQETSLNIDTFLSFLDMANTAELLQDSLHENKSSLCSILFDSASDLKGIENLSPLLRAIKEREKVSFMHFNFNSDQGKEFEIEPYLLKEYQKRWYVLGLTSDKKMRTFGIDRVEQLKVQNINYDYDEELNPAHLFKHTIGIIYSSNPVQEVVLSFTPKQGKYIKTLPLHHSQKVLIDNDEECRVSLTVAPNYGLNQVILKHGNNVKVLEPKWLVDEIRDTMKDALEKYES